MHRYEEFPARQRLPGGLALLPLLLACGKDPAPVAARLRFSGPASPDEAGRYLAFILGLPDLQRGRTGDELPTNVTVMEEDAGRFFSSRDTATCWTDIDRQDHAHLGGDDISSDDYLISGVVYCVAPLAELHGNASLRIADLHFVGRLNWRVPQ